MAEKIKKVTDKTMVEDVIVKQIVGEYRIGEQNNTEDVTDFVVQFFVN